MKRSQLAREVHKRTGHGTTASISQLLGPEDQEPAGSNTKFMAAIHDVLGWPPPVDEAGPGQDELRDRLMRAWPTLTDADREMIDIIVERSKRRS